MMWIICPECAGDGKVDNPAFSNGFTHEELYEDEDFAEGYFAGRYDVTCSCCKGSGKIQVPDRSSLSAEELAELLVEEQEERDYQRMCEMERRMGA